MRALAQRARPRDLYDVINLFRHGEFRSAAAVIRDVVSQKCSFKQIPFPTLASLAPAQPELIGEWDNMLGHQLPALPPVALFWDELPEFFRWLSGAVIPQLLPSQPIEVGATVLRGPAGGIRIPGRSTPFIEVIRFAAANHLLVDLDYRDKEGNRRTRAIEPYSLRRTKDGNIILCAVNAERQESRSYLIEQIQGATILSRGFTPRFRIELTPSGPLVAPDTARGSEPPAAPPISDAAHRQRAGRRRSISTAARFAASGSSGRRWTRPCGRTRTRPAMPAPAGTASTRERSDQPGKSAWRTSFSCE